MITNNGNTRIGYLEYIGRKVRYYRGEGFDIAKDELHSILFDFQNDFTRFALRKARAALFAGTGLGKTLMEIEYCTQIINKEGGAALIVSPLAVSMQTKKMASDLMGVNINIIASDNDILPNKINITNYEKMQNIDFDLFKAIVFDESSIFKGGGEFYKLACNKTMRHDYILCATATPAPNDFTEFGRHSELLRIMKYREMKDRFFIKTGDMNKDIRLKRHAEVAFWKWLASWSVTCRNPADLDYEQNGFNLPPLEIEWIEVETCGVPFPGELFPRAANTLQERQRARAKTYKQKIKIAESIINTYNEEPWLFWVNRICEGDHVESKIDKFVQIKGNNKVEDKIDRLVGFSTGEYKRLVTKPTIAGHGMNWQHCCFVIFFPTDSYEQYYQAIKRCHRYGQKNKVKIFMIAADIEGNVRANLLEKERMNEEMYAKLMAHIKMFEKISLKEDEKIGNYAPSVEFELPMWLQGEENESFK